MAPRSLWNGTIAFGAVAVPVRMSSAVQAQTVHFHEVHLDDGARIEHRTFCAKEDKEVPREEIVRGYGQRGGRSVVVDKEEADAAGGSRSRIIDVEHFVPAADIDPVYYDKAYHLGAGDGGAQAYRLLHDALVRSGRAAIGRFTFHKRERLVAIRPADGVLVLHTLRFAEQLVGADGLDVPSASRAPRGREAEMAGRLIEQLREPFRPQRLHDEYREAVLAAIRAKARGEEIERGEEPDADDHDDLAAALKASLGRRRRAGGRRRAAKGGAKGGARPTRARS